MTGSVLDSYTCVFMFIFEPVITFRLIDLVITNYCHLNKKFAHFNHASPCFFSQFLTNVCHNDLIKSVHCETKKAAESIISSQLISLQHVFPANPWGEIKRCQQI